MGTNFTTLFFDLDNTLYPVGNGLLHEVGERIGAYMRERLHVPTAEVPALRQAYLEGYGTTLRGLQAHYPIDAAEYLAFVHDIPVHEYLKPDPALRAVLAALPQRKWIFTNADAAHAWRVLAALGLEAEFTGVIDVQSLDYRCKPEPTTYRDALARAGEPDPRRAVLLDDLPANLAPGKEMGFCTVLVGTTCPHPAADFSILLPHDLPAALPELLVENPPARP